VGPNLIQHVVKSVNFANLRDAGDPVEATFAYDEAGADDAR
jgi:imidazole glycerol phosphate synthase subunit HisF